MKKVVYLALLVAFGFVVGCKPNEDAAKTAAQDAAKSASTNTTPAK